MKPHFGQSDAAMNKLAGCNKFENGAGSISNQKVLDGLQTIASLELQARNEGFETPLEYLKAKHEEAAGMGLESGFFERNPWAIRQMLPAVNMTENMTPQPLPKGYYGHEDGCDCAVCEEMHFTELAKQQVDAAWNKLLDDYKSATMRIEELEAVLEAERKNVVYAQQKWAETEERVKKWKCWYDSRFAEAYNLRKALESIANTPDDYEMEYCREIAVVALEPETDDPSPYCQYCGAQRKESCTCGPIADNE